MTIYHGILTMIYYTHVSMKKAKKILLHKTYPTIDCQLLVGLINHQTKEVKKWQNLIKSSTTLFQLKS